MYTLVTMVFKRQPIKNVKLNVPVSIFLQNDCYVAYTPVLDLSTYGASKVEAQKNFEESIETFFASFEDARELAQVLESLGWQKQKAKWQPPEVKQTEIKLPASLVSA